MNSIGVKLMRIPASRPGMMLGSHASDPDHRPDEQRHPAAIPRDFFMAAREVTNAQFRRFRPGFHSPPYGGVDLDGADHPVVAPRHPREQLGG